ncbi:MAG: hypothetical protein RSA21_09640 [Akkermansia sp.]
MENVFYIIGFPSLYGGAGAEPYHQIPVWEKLGVKLHVIHEAYDWNAIPENAPVISFCNEDFLAALPVVQ